MKWIKSIFIGIIGFISIILIFSNSNVFNNPLAFLILSFIIYFFLSQPASADSKKMPLVFTVGFVVVSLLLIIAIFILMK